VTSIRDRLNIIRQCVLRNEHFAPSTLPSRDREKLVTVSSLLDFCLLILILRELAEIYQTIIGKIWGEIPSSRDVNI
jgi:hypothetical protein